MDNNKRLIGLIGVVVLLLMFVPLFSPLMIILVVIFLVNGNARKGVQDWLKQLQGGKQDTDEPAYRQAERPEQNRPTVTVERRSILVDGTGNRTETHQVEHLCEEPRQHREMDPSYREPKPSPTDPPKRRSILTDSPGDYYDATSHSQDPWDLPAENNPWEK